MNRASILLFMLADTAAAVFDAQAFEMGSPVDCVLGEACFIQQYVDHDPGPGAKDSACGPHSYDNHKGTDFRLPDSAAMARGVQILAVADGTMRGGRDGMADGVPRESVTGRECGNGVYIDHEDGWSTQYCHMRSGSVLVNTGDRIKAGQPLGLIGQSGDAAFPHVHVAVRKDEKIVDPFDGTALDAPCSAEGATLWSAESGVIYTPGGILSAGVQTAVPDYAAIKAASPHDPALPGSAPAMVMWVHFFGLEAGDVLAMRLTGPDGNAVAEDRYLMPKNRATQFRAVGRKRRGEAWPPGRYVGRAVLMRGGKPVATVTTGTVVE